MFFRKARKMFDIIEDIELQRQFVTIQVEIFDIEVSYNEHLYFFNKDGSPLRTQTQIEHKARENGVPTSRPFAVLDYFTIPAFKEDVAVRRLKASAKDVYFGVNGVPIHYSGRHSGIKVEVFEGVRIGKAELYFDNKFVKVDTDFTYKDMQTSVQILRYYQKFFDLEQIRSYLTTVKKTGEFIENVPSKWTLDERVSIHNQLYTR